AALVSDVEFVDDYPASVLTHARRLHRWVRGDWQILLWLFPWVPARGGVERNRLSLIARFKIFDNLRRSLGAPAWVAYLTAAWTLFPGRALGWTLAALAVIGLPVLLALLDSLGRGGETPLGVYVRGVLESLETAAAQSLITLAFLAYQATEMLHAIALTLVRMIVTQRRLLEWETAATAAARPAGLTGPAVVRRCWAQRAPVPVPAPGIA